jgi:ubiquinone/menaquinone biosynthesis C-methylase UbiE/glycosyltransferase involved in cell wall biosynthesis
MKKVAKEDVKAFWEDEACGERYGSDQDRLRYQLEPEIIPFADFESAAGKRVLEIGVGMGSDFLRWVRAGAEATGVDLTDRAVTLTRQRLAEEGLEADVRQADAENLPFEDGSFDLVYSWGVLHHTPDPEKALAEAQRVLAPGGELKVMLYHRRSWVAFAAWARFCLLRGQPWANLKTAVSRVESPGTQAFTLAEVRQMLPEIPALKAEPSLTEWDRKFVPAVSRLGGSRLGWFLLVSGRKVFPRSDDDRSKALDTEGRVRVALNAVAARPGGGLAFLLGQLPHLENETELVVYANSIVAKELRDALKVATVNDLPMWARSLPLRLLWEHVVFPRVVRDADVLYSVGSFTSVTARKPQVVVVLIPYVFGTEGKRVLSFTRAPIPFRMKSSLQRTMGRIALRQATVLVGASQFTADQIMASAKGPVEIRVAPIAGAAIETDETAIDLEFLPTRPYAMTVATEQPHKDRFGLIESWPADSPLDLLLVGHCDHRPTFRRLSAAVAGRDNVHWLSTVNDHASLSALYRRAEVVIAHSFLEGFGMTPLEAMAADVPVIATDIPPHREVCGHAALYYDPYLPTALPGLVRRLCEDPEVRSTLIAAGRERLKLFSWSRNGKQTGQILAGALPVRLSSGDTTHRSLSSDDMSYSSQEQSAGEGRPSAFK